ncbi:hypothetical protein [Mycobacteroides abscessus]|uniref:hypothetical protein n=1 Tax=Mycobacteroides abscessus TaxID=36809 RepID=UPI0019CFE953|nr:hypothetical protein [Mycobacteroides abscessus]MBN7481536.1 hypothetical protein [Mycobacteroides abscessus subsp. massiliense]
MPSTIGTTGDPVIRMHKSVGEGARAAVASLPVVDSAGMRAGHAVILEGALSDTRRVLAELARVGDVGSAGATALADQDCENAGRYRGWDSPEIQVKGEWHGPTRVI